MRTTQIIYHIRVSLYFDAKSYEVALEKNYPPTLNVQQVRCNKLLEGLGSFKLHTIPKFQGQELPILITYLTIQLLNRMKAWSRLVHQPAAVEEQVIPISDKNYIGIGEGITGLCTLLASHLTNQPISYPTTQPTDQIPAQQPISSSANQHPNYLANQLSNYLTN